jgi:DnaJ homolog subfamily B member 12
MLTSLFNFGGPSTPPTPHMVYDNPLEPTYVHGRETATLGIKYFVDPADLDGWTDKNLQSLDRTAEVNLVRHLRNECEHEITYKRRLREQAQGWWYQDPEKMATANNFKMPSCDRLQKLGLAR